MAHPAPGTRQAVFVGGTFATIALLAALPRVVGCLVEEYCFEDGDCNGNEQCDVTTGTCFLECARDEDCGDFPFGCVDNTCELDCTGGELTCPAGMVSVCGAFCIDVYEASRPDATAGSQGTQTGAARSVPGVIPWFASDPIAGMNQAVAGAACEAAGKRLCAQQEWRAVCRGLADTTYSYGDAFEPLTCNSIDTYCTCDGQDPYPHCYLDCGSDKHVMPTGSFPGCTNGFGIYDINGNVWELIASDDGFDHYRGGAYNCVDSEALHQCDYDATWNPSAKGFRCCADGEAAR